MSNYNSINSPANKDNLEAWEAELEKWHKAIDLIEQATNLSKNLASGKNLSDELEQAFDTANRLGGMVALRVGRMRRASVEG